MSRPLATRWQDESADPHFPPGTVEPLRPPPSPGPLVGLALGGGSARGWAHIGVIRALEEAGLIAGYRALLDARKLRLRASRQFVATGWFRAIVAAANSGAS